MARPVILSVDDETHVLNAIDRDLRRRFASEYRVLKASSGEEALQTVRELKKRGVPLALFLVEAAKLYPEAKKALLTAYSDTQAAITSINELKLDYYFLEPWDPPERELNPVLEGLLGDWAAAAPVLFAGIRVLGTLWSPRSHAVKDFLSRNQSSYQWLDVEQDRKGSGCWTPWDLSNNNLHNQSRCGRMRSWYSGEKKRRATSGRSIAVSPRT